MTWQVLWHLGHWPAELEWLLAGNGGIWWHPVPACSLCSKTKGSGQRGRERTGRDPGGQQRLLNRAPAHLLKAMGHYQWWSWCPRPRNSRRSWRASLASQPLCSISSLVSSQKLSIQPSVVSQESLLSIYVCIWVCSLGGDCRVLLGAIMLDLRTVCFICFKYSSPSSLWFPVARSIFFFTFTLCAFLEGWGTSYLFYAELCKVANNHLRYIWS